MEEIQNPLMEAEAIEVLELNNGEQLDSIEAEDVVAKTDTDIKEFGGGTEAIKTNKIIEQEKINWGCLFTIYHFK